MTTEQNGNPKRKRQRTVQDVKDVVYQFHMWLKVNSSTGRFAPAY